MLSLTQMWLPILLSTIAIFVVSSAIHMASPWHKGDYPRMANEDAVMDALRPLAIPPGDYFFPKPETMADMKSPAYIERVNRGPKVLMTVMPNGMTAMGPMLLQWVLFVLVVTGLAAHVASRSVGAGAPGGHVFHQVFLVSFAAYALGVIPMSIWYYRGWSLTLKSTLDAAIYAAITAAIFQWWWPETLAGTVRGMLR